MSADSLSYQIAVDSGKFKQSGKYLRPNRDSGIAETFGHEAGHNDQAFVIPANKPESKALKIGGSEYSLRDLADALTIDLDAYIEKRRTEWHAQQAKQHDAEIPLDNVHQDAFQYWHEHGITIDTLKTFRIVFSSKTYGRHKGASCFVIPLEDRNHKYLILDKANRVVEKLAQTGKRNVLFPNKTFDDGNDILLCEGFADCLKLRQEGYNAFTWSGGVTELHKVAKAFPPPRKVIICIDTDDASKKQLSKIFKQAQKEGHDTVVIHLPLQPDEGKDVCDLFKHRDKKLFESLINTAQPLKVDDLLEEVQLYDDQFKKIVLEEVLKLGSFINLSQNGGSRDINQTYFVLRDGKRMLRLFQKDAFNKTFNRLVAASCISRINTRLASANPGGIKGNVDKETIQDLITTAVFFDDTTLSVTDAKQSNLSILDAGRLHISTELSKGIVITQDFQNLHYSDLIPQEHPEVDAEFDKLYGRGTASILKAHIIAALVNENMSSKHLLLIAGSSMLGKSKMAEMICRILTNDYVTTDAKRAEKMWKKFFKTRSPVFDNIDSSKLLSEELINDLTEILTAEKTNRDVRYSEDGATFVCDVYPVMTTIMPHLLDRHDANPLKTRTILVEPERNDYAAEHLPKLCKEPRFIQKARLHMYYLAEQFMKQLPDLKFECQHRAINFFKVLFWLDETFANDYQRELSYILTYPPMVQHFLDFIDKEDLTHDYYQAGFWCKAYKEYLTNNWGSINDLDESMLMKINPSSFFRHNVNLSKYMVQSKIGDFIVHQSRADNKRTYRFERYTPLTELPF